MKDGTEEGREGGREGRIVLPTLKENARTTHHLSALFDVRPPCLPLSHPPLLSLQERVSYKQQALFSLASLPFSFKLLWAPVVDSTSFWGLGRRKAWLLPVQFLCGMLMLLASPLVGRWVGEGGPQETPDVPVRKGEGEGGAESGEEEKEARKDQNVSRSTEGH